MPPIFKLGAAAGAAAGAVLALGPAVVSGFNLAPRFSALSTSKTRGFCSASPPLSPAFASTLYFGKWDQRESSRNGAADMTMMEVHIAGRQHHHVDARAQQEEDAPRPQGRKRMAAKKVCGVCQVRGDDPHVVGVLLRVRRGC